jgi:hypothetical protein
MVPAALFAISTQARAICSLPSIGCKKLVASPPPSAMAVAPGSSRPIRASMSLASHNKAAGLVSYGLAGGARAAEHLRLACAELQIADVRQQVTLSLLTDFENYTVFKPGDNHAAWLDTLIDQVIAWSTALAPLRTASLAAARG